MNGKLAKKIRRMGRQIKPDAQDETTYKTKAHAPRWAMKTELQEVKDPETGEVILDPRTGRARLMPKQVPFRVNTNQRRVDLVCRRGVDRLMKKAFKANKLGDLLAA